MYNETKVFFKIKSIENGQKTKEIKQKKLIGTQSSYFTQMLFDSFNCSSAEKLKKKKNHTQHKLDHK